MAARKSQSAPDLQIDTVSRANAHDMLKGYRSRGGSARRSKYSPIMDAVRDAKKGEIVVVKGIPMSGILSTRNKLKREFPDGSVVAKSARDRDSGDGSYVLMVGHVDDFS